MEPLRVSVLRGGTVESVHRVHAATVRDGELVDAAGSPEFVTFFRSSAKPLQALLLVRTRPDLDDRLFAIACASHEGESAHIEAVRDLLAAARATEDDLECGPQDDRPPGRIQHNCSGKHAGMLAVCRARGWPFAGYRLAEHPLQLAIAAELRSAAGDGELPTAIDGCGVVTFALSLERMALAFSRLPELEGGQRVLDAMRAHPQLVGGASTIDTRLMRAVPGCVAKRGAEGLLCGLLEDGTGFALKVEDGAQRAVQPAIASFLHIPEGAFPRSVPIRNSRDEEVGEVVVE